MPPKIDHNERSKAAADARKALLERFKANRPNLEDPEVQARLAERKAMAEARDLRLSERARQKAEEAARAAAEEATRKREEAARIARERAETAARAAQLAAEQKAARDARYAARKAKLKKR
jgi:hypothetical protein